MHAWTTLYPCETRSHAQTKPVHSNKGTPNIVDKISSLQTKPHKKKNMKRMLCVERAASTWFHAEHIPNHAFSHAEKENGRAGEGGARRQVGSGACGHGEPLGATPGVVERGYRRCGWG